MSGHSANVPASTGPRARMCGGKAAMRTAVLCLLCAAKEREIPAEQACSVLI